MKTRMLLILVFISCTVIARGQDPKGELYWVVESNRNVADHSIVKLYNADNELVHQVELNTRLDIAKRRHRKALVQIIKQHATRVAANVAKPKQPIRARVENASDI